MVEIIGTGGCEFRIDYKFIYSYDLVKAVPWPNGQGVDYERHKFATEFKDLHVYINNQEVALARNGYSEYNDGRAKGGINSIDYRFILRYDPISHLEKKGLLRKEVPVYDKIKMDVDYTYVDKWDQQQQQGWVISLANQGEPVLEKKLYEVVNGGPDVYNF